MRDLGSFIPLSQFEQQARQQSGAPGATGMAPYPLYGLGQEEPALPFYRRPLVCFGAGAATVGALWLYFGWWRPKQKRKAKRNPAPEVEATDDDSED